MSTAAVYLESVGLAAPGLAGWTAAQPVLRGTQAYVAAELPRFAPSLLPPNERRRATQVGRLAFQAAEEAVQGSDIPASELGAVFASSGGDTEVLDRLCAALATAECAVSPTDFHNSVHNAAAGYWSIATRSRQPSTSLSAYDSSFAAGLLEAVSVVQSEQLPVLLVAYDLQPPGPLLRVRPLLAHFGTALLLTPGRRPGSRAELRVSGPGKDAAESRLEDPGLEALRSGNPAARALPLLAAVARGQATALRLPYFDGCVGVELAPCR